MIQYGVICLLEKLFKQLYYFFKKKSGILGGLGLDRQERESEKQEMKRSTFAPTLDLYSFLK